MIKNKILIFLNKLKSIFLTGLFTLIPISITIFFITFAINTFTHSIIPLKKIEPEFLTHIPGIELLLIISFIILIGIISKFFIIKPIVHYFEKIINKIPVIRTIYSGAKTLVDFFNLKKQEENVKRQVVLIRYPNEHTYNIAFIWGSAKDSFQKVITAEYCKLKDKNDEYVRVFMPFAATHTGCFFIIPKSQTIPTNISFEEAIKTVVSCGLITPESLKELTEKK